MPDDNTDVAREPLEGTALIRAVRGIVAAGTGRWKQDVWTDNKFRPDYFPGELVENMRGYALAPVPDVPENPDNPVCGSRGCAAGWAAVLGSPAGTTIGSSFVYFPDGWSSSIAQYAALRMGISRSTSVYLFDGFNTQEYMLAALDALIADPGYDISQINQDGTVGDYC